MKKTGFVRTLVVMTALFMAVPTGTAGASGPALESPVVPAPTQVDVGMSGLGGLDRIEVDAGTNGPHSPDALPTSWACVSGSRSEMHTETREAGEVEVIIRHYEQGCTGDVPYRQGQGPAFSHYHFDTLAWEATADGEIPTSVSVSRWERRADGELELVQREERQSTAEVDLTWSGEGPEQVSQPVSVYSCYAPGPLCIYAGVQIRRAASVAGSVHLGGLGATATLPDGHPGWMEWGRIYRVI